MPAPRSELAVSCCTALEAVRGSAGRAKAETPRCRVEDASLPRTTTSTTARRRMRAAAVPPTDATSGRTPMPSSGCLLLPRPQPIRRNARQRQQAPRISQSRGDKLEDQVRLQKLQRLLAHSL